MTPRRVAAHVVVCDQLDRAPRSNALIERTIAARGEQKEVRRKLHELTRDLK